MISDKLTPMWRHCHEWRPFFSALGYGCLLSPTLVMVGRYFNKRLSLANGIVVAGVSSGTMLIPLLLVFLMDTFGFRGALMVYAGVIMHIIVGGALFRPISFYATEIPPADGGTTQRTCTQRLKQSLPNCSILKNRCFVLYLFGMLLAYPGYLNSFVFFPPFAENSGFNKQQVALTVTGMGILDLFGSVSGGFLADFRFIPRHYIFAMCLLILGVCDIIAPFFQSVYSVYILAGVVGLFGGCFCALFPVILIDFIGKEKMAEGFGMQNLFMGITSTLLPILLGR